MLGLQLITQLHAQVRYLSVHYRLTTDKVASTITDGSQRELASTNFPMVFPVGSDNYYRSLGHCYITTGLVFPTSLRNRCRYWIFCNTLRMALHTNLVSSTVHPNDSHSVRRYEEDGTVRKISPGTFGWRQRIRYSASDAKSMVGCLSGYHVQTEVSWQNQLVSYLHRSHQRCGSFRYISVVLRTSYI